MHPIPHYSTPLTPVSAPITSSRYIIQVETTNKGKGTFRFGPLGSCILETASCSHVGVPYNISGMLADATGYNGISAAYTDRTGQLALVPVTAGKLDRG